MSDRSNSSNDAVADLLRRTRTDRGLPERITDEDTLRRVARLVARGGDRR
jgi:hypothetical protein